MSSSSTLDPDNLPQPGHRRRSPDGHDTRSLGPSDSSSTGSDMNAPGLPEDDAIGLDRGTHEDPGSDVLGGHDAGARRGDSELDSDTDRSGTGERSAAGRESAERAGYDHGTDRIVSADEAGLGGGLDQGEEARRDGTDEQASDDDTDER